MNKPKNYWSNTDDEEKFVLKKSELDEIITRSVQEQLESEKVLTLRAVQSILAKTENIKANVGNAMVDSEVENVLYDVNSIEELLKDRTELGGVYEVEIKVRL